MRVSYILLLSFIAVSCNGLFDLDIVTKNALSWSWLESEMTEEASRQLIYKEKMGEDNPLRLHQSMSIYDNKAFCFNHGVDCFVLDTKTKRKYYSESLPESSHHNNAQFLDVYYQSGDKYPLLLLSRGDYPPNQNEFYIVRVEEKNDSISFHRVKTIKNTIVEAKNGGSWFADTKTNTLFMYTMTNGDWRVKEDNKASVFSFELPDILDPSEVVLGYEDVKNYWEYTYWIYQGGTFYNGFLYFNVQELPDLNGKKLEGSMNVLAIDARDGLIKAVLPLKESMETEGITVYNNKLYVSYKNGSPIHKATDTVFQLIEYSLPSSIVKKAN